MTIHYNPPAGRAGDVIPFYADGRFHLFYLLVDDIPGVTGSTWAHISSDDLTTWKEHPTAIPRGNADDADHHPATGSVIEKDGVYHAFYTGFSDARRERGLPHQTVLKTTSTDLDAWTKDDDFTPLNADPEQYDPHDWRDPFVFFNPEAGEYWMLLAGALREGPAGRRGVVARYRSADLSSWELMTPLWAPYECHAHECPDLFKMGDWWYLLYSPISDRQVTRYRMSRSLEGPWLAPAEDALDDDGLYAAKTMSDGERCYLAGWVPTRVPEQDNGRHQWGGTIVVHELTQRPDGILAVSIPTQVLDAAGRIRPTIVESRLGEWAVPGSSSGQLKLTGHGPDQFGWCHLGDVPQVGAITVDIRPEPGIHEVGMAFRTDENLDAGYLLRILPGLARIELDYFTRPAFEPTLHERPLVGEDLSMIRLTLAWDHQTLVASVNDSVVMSGRTHRLDRHWGVFVEQGTAHFTIH